MHSGAVTSDVQIENSRSSWIFLEIERLDLQFVFDFMHRHMLGLIRADQ